MSDDITPIEAAIAALQAQRGLLGDAAVDAAVGALRDKLNALQVARTAAAAPIPDEQQLRHVSVLFTDVVGSTTLSHHLDTEDVNAVINGALQRFTAIVLAHDGKVMQYAGDSVLALFGTPLAREDDAERAVLAGLAIVAEGERHGELVRARHGRDGFGVRVGINSGPVLIGGGIEGGNSVRGMTVNIAARMEQTAPPGTLRISQETYREVRGRFDLVEQPPLLVKGRDEPMVTYLVQGVRGAADRGATRGVDGVATRMVGRAAQFAALQALCLAPTELAAADAGAAVPALRLAHVVGEAGLGKSRLVGELRRWFQTEVPDGLWLQAQAGVQGMNQPYGLLRALLTSRSGLLDSDPADLARTRWLASAAPLLGSEGAAAVLGHLLGLDFSAHHELRGLLSEARQLRDRAFFHASQLLRAWAGAGQPLVLLLDDLHWADDGTLDFVAHLRSHHTDLALLLIIATRPTLAERREDWFKVDEVASADAAVPGALTPSIHPEAAPRQLHIRLEPLSHNRSGELVGELLGRLQPLPEGLIELIVEHGEGNPFHMEELVNLMVDQGVIETGNHAEADASTWRYHPERLKALSVPPTLVGVLQARLDALPADERRTAQLAAVVGMRFWDASLTALGAPAITSLQGLLGRDLAAEQLPGSLAGLREFIFKHQSLHQVAYDSVLKRVKRELHARVAQWLLSLPGAAPLDLVAEHLERGGQPAQALDYWHRAAEAAARSYANAQALAHADRALALTQADDLPRRYAITLLRYRVLELLPEREHRANGLNALETIAIQAANPAWQAECRVLRSRYFFDAGEDVAALEHAQAAVGLMPEDAPGKAEAHASIARCLLRLGQRASFLEESKIALNLARQGSDRRIEGMVLNELGMHADDEGDYGVAIARYTEALALHRITGNRNSEGGTLNNLGYAAMALGDYKTAYSQFACARDIFTEIGNRQNEAVTWINLGITQLNHHDPEAASFSANRARSILCTTKARWLEAAALRLFGQALLALGRPDAAIAHLSSSREIYNELSIPHMALEPSAVLAQAAVAQGNLAIALSYVEQILAYQSDGGAMEGTEEPMKISLSCYLVLAACEDSRAGEVLASAHQALTARAMLISDQDQRNSFLEQVPHHREIVQAWKRMSYLNSAPK